LKSVLTNSFYPIIFRFDHFKEVDMSKNCRKHLKKVIDKDVSCYVLITCGQPSEDGQMQVEMTYQGDAVLAAYLLQSAQFLIDSEEESKAEFGS
jgi:hypothetical protein